MYKSNGTHVVSALKKTKAAKGLWNRGTVRRGIKIAPESQARNVYVNNTGSQQFNNYTVPTKQNRGVKSMQSANFSSPGPQSHALIESRETGTYDWNRGLSYAETYADPSAEESREGRRTLGIMMRNYGNAYPNAIVAYEPAYATYHASRDAAVKRYNKRVAAVDRDYPVVYEDEKAAATQFGIKQTKQLRDLLAAGRLSEDEYRLRSGIVKSSTEASLAGIMKKKEDWKKFATRDATDRFDAAIEAAEQEFTRSMDVVKPVPRVPRKAFANRLRNATRKAANETAALRHGPVITHVPLAKNVASSLYGLKKRMVDARSEGI
jgi:hypothetical protein